VGSDGGVKSSNEMFELWIKLSIMMSVVEGRGGEGIASLDIPIIVVPASLSGGSIHSEAVVERKCKLVVLDSPNRIPAMTFVAVEEIISASSG